MPGIAAVTKGEGCSLLHPVRGRGQPVHDLRVVDYSEGSDDHDEDGTNVVPCRAVRKHFCARMVMYAQSHSLRIQKRQLLMRLQLKTPRLSSACSLGVGLGVLLMDRPISSFFVTLGAELCGVEEPLPAGGG